MTRLVVSLDGGGCRGLFQAVILDRLYKEGLKMGISTKDAPCIDLVIGVSIGGINAMLMSQGTDELVPIYSSKNMRKIFDLSWWDKLVDKLQPFPIYDGKGKKEVIADVIKTNKMTDFKYPVAVVTYNISDKYPKIFTSWDVKGPGMSASIVADATTAAPVYFPAVQYEGEWFIDGGVSMNNPSLLGYASGKKLFKNENIKVLSIGTGDKPSTDWSKKKINEWGAPQWLLNGLIELSLTAPSQYSDDICEDILQENYLRLDDENIGAILLDDTSDNSTLKIRKAAENLLDRKLEQILRFVGLKAPEVDVTEEKKE